MFNISKVEIVGNAEQVYEEEVPMPKRRFTAKQLDTEIALLQARLDTLVAKKSAILAIKEDVKEEVVNDGI